MSVPGIADDAPRKIACAHFDEAFVDALVGRTTYMQVAGGARSVLPISRWMGTSGSREDQAFDAHIATLCDGPTIDLGCGPGRLVCELIEHGIAALGVDRSPHAIELTRDRGGVALQRSIFDGMPGEGSWRHALLIDGNIGIGGDPVATVARASELIVPGGTVVVELEAGLPAIWSGSVRVEADDVIGPWFPWARAGIASARELAERANLHLGTAHVISGRHLVEMIRPE